LNKLYGLFKEKIKFLEGGRGGVIGVDSKKVDVCEIGEKFEQENSASEE